MSANSETELDRLRVHESIVAGSNPSEVLSETETPKSVDFTADRGHDRHVRTQITVRNSADTEQTERITVELSRGGATSGQMLASKRVEPTLAAGEARTIDVHTEEFRLSPGPHHVGVTTAGDADIPLTISATRVFTKANTFTWDVTQAGEYTLVTQDGEIAIQVDGETGTVQFPAGMDRNPDAPVTFGQNGAITVSETSTDSDPAAIGDSGDPTTLSVSAGGEVDGHDRTEVQIDNPSGVTVTEDVTVEYTRRGTGGEDGETIATETQTITRGANATDTDPVVFLPKSFPLGDNDGDRTATYRITVDTSGGVLTVEETHEYTFGGEYTFDESATGALELTNHHGERLLSATPTGGLKFPNGVGWGLADRRGDPTTAELDVGESLLYISDGTGTGADGSLVHARNDNGTIVTNTITS